MNPLVGPYYLDFIQFFIDLNDLDGAGKLANQCTTQCPLYVPGWMRAAFIEGLRGNWELCKNLSFKALTLIPAPFDRLNSFLRET